MTNGVRARRDAARHVTAPRFARGNRPRMQMNSRATSISQQQGFRRLKKGQPITARRVDEMGVRLPLEESPCPHRSSSSAFSVRASPLCSLLHSLSPSLLPSSRSASFYFYIHPCSLPPLLHFISPLSLSLSPSLSLFRFVVLCRALGPALPRQRREEIHFREKKEPAKNRC